MSLPETDDMTMSYNKANDTIAMSMGGRVAEELIFKDITSGASSDIQHATKIARAMVYDWGMSKKIGFLSLGDSSQVFIGRSYQTKNDFSEKLAGIADDEIMTILNSNYKRAKDVISEHIDILHEMAKLLLVRETIYKDEVDMIMAGKKTEEIVAMLEEKEKKQKAKEAKIKAEKEKFDKLQNFKNKINEGERLIKMGIITEAELDNLKKDYIEFEKKLNEELDAEGKKVEKVAEKVEAKVEKIVEKQEKPATPRKRAPAKKKTEQDKKENKNDEEG